jgi:DNA-binding LytR/AlgR family response regulator
MNEEAHYTVLIAEDEVPARELLVDLLLTRPELKLSGIARNGEEALRKLSEGEYDLALMDIHLPAMSGIDVISRLKSIPGVIFTTAYEQYAVSAFDFGAVDYLLKPFTADRFNQSIEKFLNLRKTGERPLAAGPETGLALKYGGKHHIKPYQEIIYVTSHGKNSVIHTAAEDIESPMILKDVEQRVPADQFIRIHKQHIVNIRYISSLESYIGGQYIAYLCDNDESSLPVGRKYAGYLKSRLRLD